MELRVLNDEEMVRAITEKSNIPMGQALIEAQFQSDIKGFLELFNMVGLFRIINRRFVDGEPNCAIITGVDYQYLKQLVEETK